MKRVLWMALAVLASGAGADTVRVRSGEHPGHTRLVFEVGTAPIWQLSHNGRVLSVAIQDAARGIDISGVFQSISRRRLAAISSGPEPGEVRLDLACDCDVNAFVARGTALVLDIRDVPAPHPPASASDASPPATPPAIRPRRRPAPGPEIAIAPGSVRLLSASVPDALPVLPQTRARPAMLDHAAPPPVPSLPLTFAHPPEAAGGLAAVLVEGIARAASQGLLEADTDPSLERMEGTALQPDGAGGLTGSLRIRSGMDLVPSAIVPDFPAETPVIQCGSPLEFDVASWGEERPAARQIAEARRRLVGEFDVPDAAAVRRLVRLYIYFSFGAEARSLIENLGPDLPDAAHLHRLAALVETGGGRDPTLAAQVSCAGAAVLWAALAMDRLNDEALARRNGILRAFSTLPPHLRRHFGPSLADRFAEAGDLNAVDTVGAAIDRVTEDDHPSLILARGADLTDQTVRPGLSELARSQRPEAARALIRNVESRIEGSEPVPVDLMDLLAILAFELAGTPEGDRMSELQILAHLANLQFDAAFALLARHASAQTMTDPARVDIHRRALAKVTADGDPDDFLRAAYDPVTLEILGGALDRLVLDMAYRAVDLGFQDQAAILARAGGVSDPILDVRVAYAAGDIRSLEAMSDGPAGAMADHRRADLLMRSGMYAEAREIYLRTEDDAARRMAEWRAGDWENVARDAAGGDRAAAARRVLEPPPIPSTAPAADLGAAMDAVRRSSELREILGRLLARSYPPDA